VIGTAYKWLAFSLIVLVLAVINTIPAHLLVRYLPPELRTGYVEGTAWKGLAQDVKINDFDLGEVQWHIQPLYLLLGRLQTSVLFNGTLLRGHGDLILKPDEFGVGNTAVTGEAQLLTPYIAAYGTSVQGSFKLDFETVRANAEGLQALEGRLAWQNAQFTSPTALDLGQVDIVFKQRGDVATATMTNDGNTLTLNGQAELKPGWRYSAQLRITPTGSTSEELTNTLNLLGRPDAQGAVMLNHNGSVPISSILPFLHVKQTEN
jgi:general secretion pathway protein N